MTILLRFFMAEKRDAKPQARTPAKARREAENAETEILCRFLESPLVARTWEKLLSRLCVLCATFAFALASVPACGF